MQKKPGHSLLEAFVEFRRPAVVLGFGGKLPLFVTEVRANDEEFHEGPEALGLPFQVIRGHHWITKSDVCQTHTKKEKTEKQTGCDPQSLLTFHVNLVFTVGLRQNVHTHDHLANSFHPRCCKRRKPKRWVSAEARACDAAAALRSTLHVTRLTPTFVWRRVFVCCVPDPLSAVN